MLLLPYNQETQTSTFLKMECSKMYDLKVPEFEGCWLCGSSNGWLAINDNNLHLSLFNPLTRACIKHPWPTPILDYGFHLRIDPSCYIHRVVLSGDPSSPSCLVAVIFSHYSRLGIFHPGKDDWRMAKSNPESSYAQSYYSEEYKNYDDVIFYQGKIFAVQLYNVMAVFDYGDGDLRGVETIPLPSRNDKWLTLKKHLVELCGQLLFIQRFGKVKENGKKRWPHKTWRFEVYRLEEDLERLKEDDEGSEEDDEGSEEDDELGEKIWIKVNNLGGKSLLLGPNDTICISPEELPWCKSNCIYFTQDNYDRNGYQWDNGVYSLEEDRVIEEFDIRHSLSSWSESALWYQPKF